MVKTTLIALAVVLVAPTAADAAMTRKELTHAVRALQAKTTLQARHIRILQGRDAVLEERVSALERRTSALEASVSTLEGWKAGCLFKQPVTRYGDWIGHLYGFTYTNAFGSSSFQSALDFTHAGDLATEYLVRDLC
jgi:hypothetical protein